MSLPEWARDAPDANVYTSNAGGVWQIYAWDRADGTKRQVTDRPSGTMSAALSPDGGWIFWFGDTNGDEFGSWWREPFDGGAPPEAALPGIPDGYQAGLQVGHTMIAAGVSTDAGSALFARAAGQTTCFYRGDSDATVAALAPDEQLIAITHAEHGDSRHPAVRVYATRDFSVVADKWDGVGKGLTPLAFAPVRSDGRLLLLHERHRREQPLIWDVLAGTETEIELDLPGEVTASWYPDGTALLVVHTYQARRSLYRYQIRTGDLSALATPPGWISAARVRPDGAVEYSCSSTARPTVIRTYAPDGTDEVLLAPSGTRAPESVPAVDLFVAGADGQIHALVCRPPHLRDGPLPTVFTLHGGPHYADHDQFSPYHAVWVDAGFAVVRVNYRGSTGYGSAWRDAIEGRPGLTELQDVAAVHDWLVRNGLADPASCVVAGPSWGGYLTLLALGTQPDRWAAGVASIPVADYVMAYEDEMEQLRAFDRALLGGTPDSVPAAYEKSSPITYVAAVRAPVLVLAGASDPRCPVRQIDSYLARLAERGGRYEVYRYDAGHGSLVTAEMITQTMTEVHFALRAIGRATASPAR